MIPGPNPRASSPAQDPDPNPRLREPIRVRDGEVRTVHVAQAEVANLPGRRIRTACWLRLWALQGLLMAFGAEGFRLKGQGRGP